MNEEARQALLDDSGRVKVYLGANKQNKRGLPRMRQSSLIYPAYMASSYCAFTKVKLSPSSER